MTPSDPSAVSSTVDGCRCLAPERPSCSPFRAVVAAYIRAQPTLVLALHIPQCLVCISQPCVLGSQRPGPAKSLIWSHQMLSGCGLLPWPSQLLPEVQSLAMPSVRPPARWVFSEEVTRTPHLTGGSTLHPFLAGRFFLCFSEIVG